MSFRISGCSLAAALLALGCNPCARGAADSPHATPVDAAIDNAREPPAPPAPPPAPPKIGDCTRGGGEGNFAIDAKGPADRVARDLIAQRKLVVQHAERITAAPVEMHFGCVEPKDVLSIIASASGAAVEAGEHGAWKIVAVKNGPAIAKLREQAGKQFVAKQVAAWKKTLERIVALSVPGAAGELQADVEDEYHDLGNTAMAEKNYVLAETYFRKRLQELERTGANDDANYGIAVSNVADAREYQDDLDGAKALYERALGVMEHHPGPLSQPNRVIILGTLSDNALAAKRLDEAESYGERMWQVLADPQRAQWDRADSALDFGSQVESELGRIGAETQRLKHYSRALELKVAQSGADSAGASDLRRRAIFAAQHQGETARAVELSEQELAAATRRGETTGADYVVTLYRLLAIDAHQRKLDRAIAHWLAMIEVRRSVLGAASPHVADAQRDLAALYRLNRQWAPARAADAAAKSIKSEVKPEEDAAALKKLDGDLRYAMEYDPALAGLCARIGIRRMRLKTPGTRLSPPLPMFPPNVFFDIPDPAEAGEPPQDALGQAELLEQSAECNVQHAGFAADELELALKLRTSAQGGSDAATQAAARRLLEIYEASGDKEKAQRVRALVQAGN